LVRRGTDRFLGGLAEGGGGKGGRSAAAEIPPGRTIPAANNKSKGSGKRNEVFIRFNLH